jgi:hypothetical protein
MSAADDNNNIDWNEVVKKEARAKKPRYKAFSIKFSKAYILNTSTVNYGTRRIY